jgi:hypothetical protein
VLDSPLKKNVVQLKYSVLKSKNYVDGKKGMVNLNFYLVFVILSSLLGTLSRKIDFTFSSF